MGNSLEMLLTKASKSAGNQTALGALLGLGPNAISDWKHGRRAINSERIAELARVAGEDEGKWVALITIEKTGHEGAKKWIQQLAGTALCIMFLAPFIANLCIMLSCYISNADAICLHADVACSGQLVCWQC